MVAQAALIAAGINFASGFLKGKQEEYEAKVQAKLALNNAAIYRKNAARVRLNGSLNEDMMRSQKRAAVASAAAAAGEAGMAKARQQQRRWQRLRQLWNRISLTSVTGSKARRKTIFIRRGWRRNRRASTKRREKTSS